MARDNNKLVYVGNETTCAKCSDPIPKGARAWKHSRRAETYRERSHADQHGNVTWYRHYACWQPPVFETRS